MLREGFHHIRGNALMALSFIRRSFPVGLGLFLVGALGLSGLPPTQQERAAHAGVAQAGREVAQSWYFLPYPARGQGWQTIVMLTNLGSRELRVNFAAYDEDGEFLGASTIRLAAQARRTLETGEVLPEGGTLKVEAKEHLWAGAIFRTRHGTKAEVLPALGNPSRQLDFPALLPGDLSGKTITLLNSDSASAHLEVVALDQGGAELSRTLLPSLPPMASHTFAVRDLFSGDILQQLSTVRVISDRGIVGLQLVDPPDGDLVGLPALTITSQEWSFPIATQGEAGELWTSVGLFNLGEVSTSVTVEAFDDANNSLGIIDGATLLPGATHFVLTANMGGIIPPQAASLKVIADQSISGYEVIGVKEGMGVTATLGIPEEDQIRVGFDLTGSKDGRVLTVSPLVRIGDGSIRSTGGTIGAGEWKEVVSVKPSGAVTEVIAQESNAALQTISTSGPVAGLSLIWPVPPNIGQDYAQYDWGKADEHHTGLDISGVKGKTTVRAAADGWIVKIQENDDTKTCGGGPGTGCEDHGFGNTVIIKHQIGSTVVYTQYSHLDSIKESLKQACGPVDRGRKKRRTCKVPVEVKANDELGKVGCTLYGKSDCKMSNGPHLHFELKDFGTLTPAGDDKQLDDDDGFGYTFSHPDKVGYHDPILNLHQVSSIAEIRVRVTAAGQGTSIRVGPAGYRALRTVKKGEEFIAFRTSPASPACSEGWYQIRPTDKSDKTWKVNNKKVNNELYFQDPSRPGSAIPDAWICKGNRGQVWVEPISTPTTFTLTVTKSGTGSGTVTSNPAGINCGTDCSETYPSGTKVTLTATPASGSIFSGWGGDCSSCGASSTCTITMDKDKTCTATFQVKPQDLPDLVVSSLSNPPASVPLGGSFTVTDTTQNQGTATAGASTTRYRLSTDPIITSSDPLLTGSRSVPSLAAGASSSGSVLVTVPTTIAPGSYYLGACADDLGVVAESNETNNCRASTTTVQVTVSTTVQWAKTYGGPEWDGASSIQQTADGGYIVAGWTFSFGAGDSDFWVLKLDQSGNVQWQKAYGGPDWDRAFSIQQTSDGGYIVAGETWSFGAGDSDFWVLKLDRNGDVQWQKAYGGPSEEHVSSIQQTADGGYIVAGTTKSFFFSGTWVLKLDRNGNVQWQKTYGGLSKGPVSIQQTADGEYIVAGKSEGYDIWVLRLDRNGNPQWGKTYGGLGLGEALSIQQTSDGGYIVAGETWSFGAGDSDFWVLKLDRNGDVQWQKAYGGPSEEHVSSIQQTADGGYIVAGTTYSFAAGYTDIWVLKLDQSGNVQWQKTYGGPSWDKASSIQQTADGGYIVAGSTYSFGWDIWVLKLDANGDIGGCSLIGTSNATVSDTTLNKFAFSVGPGNTSASGQNSSAVITETNVTPSQQCGAPL